MIREPKRLRAGSDELAAGIESLGARLPSEAKLAALAERLSEAGAPVKHASMRMNALPSAIPAPGLFSRLGPKLFDAGTLAVVAALILGAGIVAVAVVVREAEAPVVAPGQPPVVAPERASNAQPPIEGTRTRAPAAEAASSDAPEPAARERGTPARGASSIAVPEPTASVVPPQPRALRIDSARIPATGAVPSTHTANLAPAGNVPPGKKLAASGASPSTPSNLDAPLAENTAVTSEIELLKAARSALSADPLEAFALSERCRAQYPNGSFAQEREYIAISALLRLGRNNEARSRAALFRMHYPNSAYLPRLERALGEP